MPSLIPKKAQIDLLSTLLHRDLANRQHRTNVHLHHDIPYHATVADTLPSADSKFQPPQDSFFNMSPNSASLFLPLDDSAHKPFDVSQFLNRKLRWVTLGGQYDWTQKKYPSENPPFPPDIADFALNLFPMTKAEAAIVNIYSPGDTLSMHRDVSEESQEGLASISLGCDALFVVGLRSKADEDPKCLVLRLHSGDALFMAAEARFAWHGVPQIIPDTCPAWLCSWPARETIENIDNDIDDPYEPWRNWMSDKRVNLNIRQMRD